MGKEASPNLLMLIRIALYLTLVVIVLGAYTRLSDAGLGCPDWPGCYGQLSVPTQSEEISKANQLFPERAVEPEKAWLEMIHRYFAGSLGLLVFVITSWCLSSKTVPKLLPCVIAVVIVFQAALGMWTVTLKLMPLVVMAHLLGGFTVLSLLALLYCQLKQVQQNIDHLSVDPSIRYIALGGLVVLVGQIFLGGWTSSNYAALMCTSLPICEGDWSSHLDFSTAFDLLQSGHENYEFGVLEYPARMTIHVTHRFGAIATALVFATLVFKLISQPSETLNRAGWVIACILTIQLSLGVSNVVFHLPLAVAVLHNLGAAIMLVGVVIVNYMLWRQQVEYSELMINDKREVEHDG